MSSQTLYRLAGMALLIGGLLAILGTLVQAANDQPLNPAWVPATLLILIGGILTSFGLPAVYVRQAARIGIWGLVGFMLLVIAGVVLGAGDNIVAAFITPFLTRNAPALIANPIPAFRLFLLTGNLIYTMGAISFGIVTLRANTLSRAAAILLLISAVVGLVGGFANIPYTDTVAVVLLNAAFMWFGYNLSTKPGGGEHGASSAVTSAENAVRV